MSKTRRVLIAVLMLGVPTASFAAKAACDNCVTIANWYAENTYMTANEIGQFLTTCGQVNGCWGM